MEQQEHLIRNYYRTRLAPDPRRAAVWKAICEYLQPEIPEGGALLDLGSGYGDFVNQIRASRKYALDINPEAQAHCARGVEFIHSGVGQIPLEADSVDVVFASNLLEHLEDPLLDAAIRQIRRILKADGKLILLQLGMCFFPAEVPQVRKKWANG